MEERAEAFKNIHRLLGNLRGSAFNTQHLSLKTVNRKITSSCCIRLLISRDFQKGKRMLLDQWMESYYLERTSMVQTASSKFKQENFAGRSESCSCVRRCAMKA